MHTISIQCAPAYIKDFNEAADLLEKFSMKMQELSIISRDAPVNVVKLRKLSCLADKMQAALLEEELKLLLKPEREQVFSMVS